MLNDSPRPGTWPVPAGGDVCSVFAISLILSPVRELVFEEHHQVVKPAHVQHAALHQMRVVGRANRDVPAVEHVPASECLKGGACRYVEHFAAGVGGEEKLAAD